MLETIYITRHGFRSSWIVDNSGNYNATITSPTNIPSDPPLASHGVDQAKELTAYVLTLASLPERIVSSPFYRCLETINPLAEALDLPLLVDNGIGEWYGRAQFEHPSPASPELLHTFFPRVRTSHAPSIIPSPNGETMAEVHDRVAFALSKIISDIDAEWTTTGSGPKAILLCTHAATNIAAGRALTGAEEMEIRTGTCSLGVYKRKAPVIDKVDASSGDGAAAPRVDWKGKGVGGGWDCVVNGDCSFLKGGEERNWWFNGDEDWDFPVVPTAAVMQEAKI